MEKSNWILEILKLYSGFIIGISTDKFLKRGRTKIIENKVCFYFPFALQGESSEINKIELHLQFINSSGN